MHSPTLIGIRRCVGSAEFRIIVGRIRQVLLYCEMQRKINEIIHPLSFSLDQINYRCRKIRRQKIGRGKLVTWKIAIQVHQITLNYQS